MVANVSFWIICGTGSLQLKCQHHPQESYSSGPHHDQGPSARQAIHSRKARQNPTHGRYPFQQSALVQKTGSPESPLPAGGTISS